MRFAAAGASQTPHVGYSHIWLEGCASVQHLKGSVLSTAWKKTVWSQMRTSEDRGNMQLLNTSAERPGLFFSKLRFLPEWVSEHVGGDETVWTHRWIVSWCWRRGCPWVKRCWSGQHAGHLLSASCMSGWSGWSSQSRRACPQTEWGQTGEAAHL